MVGRGVQMIMGSGVHIVGGSSWERETSGPEPGWWQSSVTMEWKG